MSKVCEVCCRGPKRAASRSHSNIRTLRKQKVNLQTKKIDGQKIKVCTRCLKTVAGK